MSSSPPLDAMEGEKRYLICEEHIVFATFEFAICHWCSRDQRAREYVEQKKGNHEVDRHPNEIGSNTTEEG